jgi:hypothetical protein
MGVPTAKAIHDPGDRAMSYLSKKLAVMVLSVATLGVAAGAAASRPPANSKPLEEIAAALEQSEYVIVEASFDDGLWEVDAYKGDTPYELHLDPATGKVLATHPDDTDPLASAGAMKLSAVLKEVSKSGYAPIVSADFEHGQWEVEAYKNGAKRELQVEPQHGKIVSDRADD